MAIVPQFDGFTSSLVRRAAIIFMFACTLLAVSTAPAFASLEWCSRDPVLTFTRQTAPGELAVPNVIDVQVMEPAQASSMGDVATLTVTLPSNVDYQEVDTSTPVFQLDTTFKPVLDPVVTDAYTVRLAAYIPNSSGSYPVRLMVTDPVSGASVTCEGQTGQTVRARVQFAPFAVACQQTTVSGLLN